MQKPDCRSFGKTSGFGCIWKLFGREETKLQINQDAVRIMKELYGIDMEAEGQYSKLIDEIPVPDIAISMGCNVGWPFIERPFDDNWGLEDPTGKSDEEFKKVIDEIRMQIFILKQRLDEFEEN